MPKSIEQLLDELIAREGGYVNHAADRGGPTNFGITEAVARAYGYAGGMRDLPKDIARRIYRERYWTRPGFSDVAAKGFPRLAEEMFDTGVNMGPKVAATFLQRALNVLNQEGRDFPDLAADGDIGPMTLFALDAFKRRRGTQAEGVLVKAVEAQQGERYIRLAEGRPSQEAFVFGWLAHRIGNAG